MSRTTPTPTLTVALAAGALLLAGCSAGQPGRLPPTASTTASPTLAAQAQTPTASPTQLPPGVLASIPLDSGSAPSIAAVGFGAVWVGAHRANTLYRINPARGTVQRIDLGQSTCGPIRVGLGRVFTGACDGSTKTMVVNPATNQVVASFDGGEAYGFTPGVIWTGDPNGNRTLLLDSTTYKVITTLPVPGIEGLLVGGYVWVADENLDGVYDGTIAKIDPASHKVVQHVRTEPTGPYMYMTYSDGALWLHGAGDGFLIRVDMATGRSGIVMETGVSDLSDFGDQPLVSGQGSLWVRASASTVEQLDGRTGALVGSYPADPQSPGGWPAVGFGSLWVVNFDSDTVWRVRTRT